ncbi:helix-turn-helix transcriptional regulator [Ferrimonas lipolytica]|uniref:Response regulator transcription factor n=1 Tax=Ferrimonas lipolytica TaxID=2724191 RepID=A0A6H1UCC6_9GAMM|nr:response regulator transcription factor [Ferrimonas lipolytica]QIZ75462.1 response regulator transcription factor [Ferrimonas lipolytica]
MITGNSESLFCDSKTKDFKSAVEPEKLLGQVLGDLLLIDYQIAINFIDSNMADRLVAYTCCRAIVLMNCPKNINLELLYRFNKIRGLLHSDDSELTCNKAIAHLKKGGIWLPKSLMEAFFDHHHSSQPSEAQLSNRQRQILELLLMGYDNKKIAEQLFISINTVKVHLHNIYRVFDVHNKKDVINRLNDIKQMDNIVEAKWGKS